MANSKKSTDSNGHHGSTHEPVVMTLEEVADFLRLSVDETLLSIRNDGLPARRIGAEWRFLRSAVQQWLAARSMTGAEAVAKWAGAFRDDPFLDQIVKDAYRRRRASKSDAKA